MTVVISEHDFCEGVADAASCAACGRKPLHFPFLWWRGETDICICGKCCVWIKGGFMADLIHVAAIVEMQKANPGYAHDTLQRRSPHALKAEADRLKRAELDRV